jgi:hypothetical protein
MRHVFTTLGLCTLATPVGAQFTTTYTGVQRNGDKEYPATAVFSVESGRIAMIMTGSKHMRMLFDDRAQVIHVVLEDEKQYFDIDKNFGAAMDPSGMMAQMQKQLEAMPKEQRAMAEAMMSQAMGGRGGASAPQLTYNWTKDKQTISGYECTRVEGMRGPEKVTEYCGATSPDLKLTDADRQTVLDMQPLLRSFTITVRSGDDATRAFTWDTATDGYPVLTRCFVRGTMTLELTLATVTRRGPTDDQFSLSGFTKLDITKMGRGGN